MVTETQMNILFVAIASFLLFLIVVVLISKPKKKVTYVANEKLNQVIDIYNTYVERVQSISELFISELNKKQRLIVLQQDGYANQKCMFLVEEFNKSSDTIETRLHECKEHLNNGQSNGIESILADLDDDILNLKTIYKNLCAIKIERNSFDTVFQTQTTETVSSVSYFSDCDTKEKLSARYKSLVKAFHPDTKSGNEEMFKAIQKEYDEMVQKI